MNGVVRASIPVQLQPSQAEIVFSPETQSYALSFGITVTLPVNELVETLLRFNAEQQSACKADEPEPILTGDSICDILVDENLASEANLFGKLEEQVNSSVATSETTDFDEIPISLIRSDTYYQDYVQRSKWQYAESTFLVKDVHKRAAERCRKESAQAESLARRKQRSASNATTAASESRLSADAPVFLPRGRAFSENNNNIEKNAPSGARARAMTATSSFWSPPTVEEDDDQGCKQM